MSAQLTIEFDVAFDPTPFRYESESRPIVIGIDDWWKVGESLFGHDRLKWRFVCPACGHIADGEDWKEAGAIYHYARSCVRNWTDKGCHVHRDRIDEPHPYHVLSGDHCYPTFDSSP